MTTLFSGERYLRWLQVAVAKHYDKPNAPASGSFRVIGLNCKVQTGSYEGKHVVPPRTPHEMEQVVFLAREQLIATLEDGNGCLEFDPQTLDDIWGETDDDNAWTSSEVIGHAFDIINDTRVWESVTDAALTFRRAAEAREAREALKAEPKTVAEARARRDALETLKVA